MSDTTEKWDQVGESFTALGQSLKGRFDANAAFGPEEREQVNGALHEITEALDASFTTIGDAFRDPAIRDEMKHVGSSISDAIAATLRDVSDAFKKL